jgi:uncharacterized protein (DUF2126 family)
MWQIIGSCAWEFRRGNCFLVPGNSPIGLRLPLDSLPKTSKNKKSCCRQKFIEDLPALGDYDEKIKAAMEQYQNYLFAAKKSFIEEEKTIQKRRYFI